jgi:hypothetical protein
MSALAIIAGSVYHASRTVEQPVLAPQVKINKVGMFHALAAATLGARPNAIKSYRPRNEAHVPAIDSAVRHSYTQPVNTGIVATSSRL